MGQYATIYGDMDPLTVTTADETFVWTTPATLEVVRLHRDTLGHADLFQRALARMTQFSEQMGVAVGNSADTVWQQFAQASPLLGLWVAHRNHIVEAHLHADIRPWNGENVGWIAQANVDDPALFRSGQIDTILHEVCTWLKSINEAMPQAHVTKVLFATFRDSKVWQRRFGFTPHSTILQRSLL